MYYVRDKGGERGPFTKDQLRSMWNSGAITADAEYRADGQAFWSGLVHLMEVASAPLPKPPPKAVIPGLNEPKTRMSGCGVALIILFAIAIMLGVIATCSKSPVGSTNHATAKKMQIEVRWSFDAIIIKNVGSPEIEGKTVVLYINGTPPFTYQADCVGPKLNESSRIPLKNFVHDGARFDTRTQAVSEAWIGGAGFDYVQFRN